MQLAGKAEPNAGNLSELDARRADLIWAAAVIVSIGLLFAVLKLAGGAAVPIFVALLGAWALDPAADSFERRGLSRTAAVLVLFVLMGAATAGVLLYLVPAVGTEMAKLPTFFRDIGIKALPRIEGFIGRPLPENVRDAAAAFSQQGTGLAEKALPSVAGVALGALTSTASVLMFSFGLLVVPVLTFHLLRDYDRFVAHVRGYIPRKYEPLISLRFGEMNSVLGGFVRGQLTVGAILTCMYAFGLSMARIDLAVVIAAVAGFGTMVPYVGPGIGMVLAVLSLAVSWQGAWQIGAVAATFGFAMTTEGLFITPRIVGGRVGLSAVSVMIAILVFGNLLGFVGVLLAVPVTAALKVVARVVLTRYQRSKLFEGTP